ncbi:MAG: hypothetical protein ABIA93_05650 [Candidatus Woesearchaeota archaeon]
MKKTIIFGIMLFALVISMVTALGSTVKDAAPTVANINEVKSPDPDYSGNLPLSFNIMNVPSRSSSISLVLGYSQGIRVDQESSWVGLGFNLGLGSITRSVVNKPDDSSTGLMNGNEEDDFQQDTYFFSVGGEAGRIMLVRQAGKYLPVLQTWKPWKITYYDANGNLYGTNGGIARWEILTDDGTTYVFNQTVKTAQTQNNQYVYSKRVDNGQCPLSNRCGNPNICESSDTCSCSECTYTLACQTQSECDNGFDDDDDGCIDMADDDCESKSDNKEGGSQCPRTPSDRFHDANLNEAAGTSIEDPSLYSDYLPPLWIGGVYLANGHPWPMQSAYCNTSGTPPQQMIFANSATTTTQIEVEEYANSWKLTEIKYADYLDTNINNITDDDDYGDWTKIRYADVGSDSFSSIKKIAAHDENPVLGVYMNPKCERAKQDHPFPHDTAFWSDPTKVVNLDCEYFGGVPLTNRYNFIKYAWTNTATEMIYLQQIETPTFIADFELGARDDLINRAGAVSPVAKRLKNIKLKSKIDDAIINQVVFDYTYLLADSYDNPPKLTLLGFSQVGKNSAALPSTTFEYDYNPQLQHYAFDWYGFSNGVVTNNNGMYDDHSSNDEAKAWSLTAINYPYGGRVEIEYEPMSFDFVQNEPVSRTTGGGIRVSSITRYDGLESSGSTVAYTYDNCTATLKPRLTKGIISGFTNIAPGMKNYVACSVVTMHLPAQKGTVVQKYSSPIDYPDTALDSTKNPHMSMDWKRGQLISIELFDFGGDLIKKSERTYNTERTENQAVYNEADGLSQCVGDPVPCGLRSFSANQNENWCYGSCYVSSAGCEYYPGVNIEYANNVGIFCEGITSQSICDDCGTLQHPCRPFTNLPYCEWGDSYYRCVGQATSCRGYTESQCKPEIGCVWAGDKEISSGWVTLDQETSTQDGISLTRSYAYNTINGLPSKIIETDGTKTKITKVTYAFEHYDGTVQPNMLSRNMLSAPYESFVYYDTNNNMVVDTEDELVSYSRTEYSEFTGQVRPFRDVQWLDVNDNKVMDAADRYTTTQRTYDPYGNELSYTDQLSRTTHFSYGSNAEPCSNSPDLLSSKLTCTRNSNNLISMKKYNTDGSVVESTDEAGRTTRYTYDDFGRLEEVYLPGDVQPSTTVVYSYAKSTGPLSPTNMNVQTVSSLVSDGQIAQKTQYFDGLGRVRAISQTENSTSNTVTLVLYDAAGNTIRSTIPARNIDIAQALASLSSISSMPGIDVVYSSDPMQRVTRIQEYGLSSSTRKSYSSDGTNLINTVTDVDNVATVQYFDARGNLVRIEGALGDTSSFEYDILGRIASSTDALGETTSIQFDSLGRLIRKESPELGVETYDYYDDGRPKSATNSRGIRVLYTYDIAGRITYTDYPTDQDITYVYDDQTHNAIGKLAEVTIGEDSMSYYYEPARGRLVRTDQILDGELYTIQYDYTESGLVSKKTLPSGLELEYEYDAMKRPVHIYGSAVGGDIFITYTSRGKIATITYPNGVKTEYSHNDKNLMSSISVSNIQEELFGETYKYDDGTLGKGQITQVYQGTNSLNPGSDLGLNVLEQFEYDALGRITTADYLPIGNTCNDWSGCADQTYTYDLLGNRKTHNGEVLHYDSVSSASILTSDDTFDYTYDVQGNLEIKKNKVTGQQTTFEYDDASRLAKVILSGGKEISYKYDWEGNRLQVIEPKVKTNFVYDSAGQLVYQESIKR